MRRRNQLFWRSNAIEQAELGMYMQVSEGHGHYYRMASAA
jgi:hypothetical protein